MTLEMVRMQDLSLFDSDGLRLTGANRSGNSAEVDSNCFAS
jgi:hypothetical protein